MKLASGPISERMARSRALVYDLRATLNGERRFFIIQIAPAKRAAFLRAVERHREFRLEDFGAILHRGWGEPDEALKADLDRRFRLYADATG